MLYCLKFQIHVGHQKEGGCPGLERDRGQGHDLKIDPPQLSISMMHTNTGEGFLYPLQQVN